MEGAAGLTFIPSAWLVVKDIVLRKARLLPGVHGAGLFDGQTVAVYL